MHAAEKWAGRELRVKVKCVRETERERTKMLCNVYMRCGGVS